MRKVFPAIPPDDIIDADFCIAQLTHFHNLPFFKSGMEAFKKKMSDAGWKFNQIQEAETTALRRSYWNNNSWVEMLTRNPWIFEDKNLKENHHTKQY